MRRLLITRLTNYEIEGKGHADQTVANEGHIKLRYYRSTCDRLDVCAPRLRALVGTLLNLAHLRSSLTSQCFPRIRAFVEGLLYCA